MTVDEMIKSLKAAKAHGLTKDVLIAVPETESMAMLFSIVPIGGSNDGDAIFAVKESLTHIEFQSHKIETTLD